MSRGGAMIVSVSLLLGSCTGSVDPSAGTADDALAAEGREVAEAQCASCHALDAGAASPRPDAPPLSALLARYNEEALAADLIEGVRLGHEDMPKFDFNVLAADALIAYMRSLSRKAP